MLCVVIGTILLNGYLFYIVPKGFFPQQDTGRMGGSTRASQDISFDAMRVKQYDLAQMVLDDPAIASVTAFAGGGGPGGGSNNVGRMFIALKPLDQRPYRAPSNDWLGRLRNLLHLHPQHVSADDVVNGLRRKLTSVPGATLFLQAQQDIQIGGRGSDAQYQYTLADENLNELNSWAPQLQARMRSMPELRDVSTMYKDINQYYVVMEVDPKYQLSPDSLNGIYIKSTTGAMVPLSAIAKFDAARTSLQVNHQGQYPAVTLSFNLAPNVALGDAVTALEKAQREMEMPSGIHATFQGSAQAFQDSLANEKWLILAALAAVYIVLGILYESLIHPFTILSSLPPAGVGAVLALMLTGTDLSIIAIIGVLLLIGIVKKNAIMMIDIALQAERDQGLPPIEAIYQASLLRFRPIMMTTMAALFGGLPLAIGMGVGSELRKPLGITIVGGLIVSQMLTLFTTPVVYLFFDRVQWHLMKLHKLGSELEEAPGD
jgi:multidrug efflux pump